MRAVLKHLRRKPLRTLLTLLQIMLGALAMTLALSAYLGSGSALHSPERFDLIAGTRSSDGSSSSYSLIKQDSLEALLKLAPAVERAALYVSAWNVTVEKEGRLYQFLSGAYVNADYLVMNNITMTQGSGFSSQDADTQAAVMLISEGAAKILFEQDAIGQTLNLMPDPNLSMYDENGNPMPAPPPEPYRVIGVFAENTLDPNQQTYVYFPLWKISEMMGASGDTLHVLAKPGQGPEAREQILAAARQTFASAIADWGLNQDEVFYIREMGDTGFADQNFINPTVVMFGLFGVVALVVGSIGIFSIMVVDALERERETGIKRALGATQRRITAELTLESSLLAGSGGLLGALLAALLIPLLISQVGNSLFWNVSLRWQPLAALTVVAITLGLGAVLGFFPALRAARVKPAEALK